VDEREEERAERVVPGREGRICSAALERRGSAARPSEGRGDDTPVVDGEPEDEDRTEVDEECPE